MRDPWPDADKIGASIIDVTMTSNGNGWWDCRVRVAAGDKDQARDAAQMFLDHAFPDKHKIVRAAPEGNEHRDFQRNCRVVQGYCRFMLSGEDGPTEYPDKIEGNHVRFLGLPALRTLGEDNKALPVAGRGFFQFLRSLTLSPELARERAFNGDAA